jgi:hypothetical protein
MAAAGITAALLISMATPAFAASKRRVIVLFAPYLTWSDISSMPNASALAERSLLANMNVRAGGLMGASTPDRGAMVLSAGASLADPGIAGSIANAYDASEVVGATPARELYLEYFGEAPGNAQILFEGLPAAVLANEDSNNPASPGALGSTVHALGAKTAAIGNGDLGLHADQAGASRPAGEAAADESGTVDVGGVSDAMLATDPAAPFGVRASVDAILTEYRVVLSDPGVRLVVVDPGDLSRAATIAPSVTSPVAASAREQALRTTDAVLGGLVAGAGPDDAIVVIAQAVVSVPDVPAGYGPAIIFDGEGGGVAVSPSTHRDGVVTEMDVSATIISLLGGVPQPSMVGSAVYAGSIAGASTAPQRIAYLDRLDTSSVAVESVRMTVVNYFIILTVLILLAATLVLYRTRDGLPAWLPKVTRWVLLIPIATLLGAVLQYVFWAWPATGTEVVVALVASTALALAIAIVPFRRSPVTLPLIVLSGMTAVLLMVDQWLGAPLSLFGLFGYSPLLGARYYGLGNEMAGLLLGSAFVTFALVLDTWPDAKWARAMRSWGWPVMGVVVLATAAAPMWGANVGPAAWMTVGILVGWLMLNGKRVLTWRNLVIVVVLILVVVVALSAIDLLGATDARTHLGRAVVGVETGGIGTLWTIVARKADTNLRVLGRTSWTWMLVALLLMLGYMRWRPRGEFAAMLKRFPALSVAIAAGLFAGLVAFFTEDSGIIIPALMFIPLGLATLYLMLVPRDRPEEDAG